MRSVFLLILGSLLAMSCLRAAEPPTFLLLGSYHMANNPGHMVASHHDDHGSPARQREILDVVERLKAFRPTRICVERAIDDPALKADWEGYLAGAHELKVNEVEQIGFRLAKNAGTADLRGFDSPMSMRGAEEAVAFLDGKDAAPLKARFQADLQWVGEVQERMDKLSVLDHLRGLNDPAFQARNAQTFQTLLQSGTDKDPLGVIPILAWHERNLRMAAALLRHARPGDRVVVIVGASHIRLLKQILEDTQGVRLEDPLAYLSH